MPADEGSSGLPNLQGSESGEMYRWQGEITANVRENTRRLDSINGQIERIEKSQELTRSDVRSLGEKLDGLISRMASMEQNQVATLQNVSRVDWKTIGTIVTLVVGPLLAAYLGNGAV